jgi:hypothetical protein
MAKNYVVTARGRKLNMNALRAANTDKNPVSINKTPTAKPVKITSIRNTVAKLNAVKPSSAPVTSADPAISDTSKSEDNRPKKNRK